MNSKKITNYYELLEVQPDASSMDIINAYRQAKLTYKTDSMATYSLFDDVELDQIRTEVEQAYQTLTSPEKRRAYDADLAAGQSNRQSCRQSGSTDSRTAQGAPTQASHQNNVVDLAAEAQASADIAMATVFSGALLKEIRELKGVELAAIAEHTRISRQYLQAIEEEDKRHLPEPAYLKGYLKQYAAEIGLDPEQVAGHYPPLHSCTQDRGDS